MTGLPRAIYVTVPCSGIDSTVFVSWTESKRVTKLEAFAWKVIIIKFRICMSSGSQPLAALSQATVTINLWLAGLGFFFHYLHIINLLQ